MITALVGHRGTGKSQLLKRILDYYQENGLCFDLDQEIEIRQNSCIENIFAEKGESHFRQLEKETFNQLVLENKNKPQSIFIALGAGFNFELPDFVKVYWIRRETDQEGRVFLNRPRLQKGISAFEESIQIFSQRESRYSSLADERLTLEEGQHQKNLTEQVFLELVPVNLLMSLTVLPENFNKSQYFEYFILKRLNWGVSFFELRDDLLTSEQIHRAVDVIPKEHLLISYREQNSLLDLVESKEQDWALELGEPQKNTSVVSLHNKKTSLEDCFAQVEAYKDKHIKLAVPIDSFKELWLGHQWWLEDCKNRSFLPHSDQGRWRWYRLLQKNKMKLNFFREHDGSSLDQPLLNEVMSRNTNYKEFAAILGDPVIHSQTPVEQRSYLSQKNKDVFKIQMFEQELTEENLDILYQFGLRAAAVTSPLKQQAFKRAEVKSLESQKIKAINTLAWNQGWQGANTDKLGFAEFIENHKTKDIAIWGGGGTLNMMKEILPQASCYSARTGELKSGKDQSPDVVIWGVGRSRQLERWPPRHWQPEIVMDLNYQDNSPGKEYAAQLGCEYVSGEKMFLAQALHQRAFYDRQLL